MPRNAQEFRVWVYRHKKTYSKMPLEIKVMVIRCAIKDCIVGAPSRFHYVTFDPDQDDNRMTIKQALLLVREGSRTLDRSFDTVKPVSGLHGGDP